MSVPSAGWMPTIVLGRKPPVEQILDPDLDALEIPGPLKSSVNLLFKSFGELHVAQGQEMLTQFMVDSGVDGASDELNRAKERIKKVQFSMKNSEQNLFNHIKRAKLPLDVEIKLGKVINRFFEKYPNVKLTADDTAFLDVIDRGQYATAQDQQYAYDKRMLRAVNLKADRKNEFA